MMSISGSADGTEKKGPAFMVVRIRFADGSAIRPGRPGYSRLTLVAASFLTLVAVPLWVLGIWRVAEDLGWAGDFVVQSGLLSHWQVWIAAAALVQLAQVRMMRYSRLLRMRERSARHSAAPASEPAPPVGAEAGI